MKSRYLHLIIALLLGCAYLPASASFDKANSLYEQEDFEGAYKIYDSIVKTGFTSAELHYNLASAAYRLDKKGEAVLHYEKALKLNPAFTDAAFNLKIVRSQLAFKQPDDYLDKSFASAVLMRSPDYWAYAGIFMLVLMSLFYVLFLYSSSTQLKRLTLNTLLVCGALAVVTFALALWQNNSNKTTRGVILEASASVLSEPSPNAKTLFILEEGATVLITDTQNDFLEVSFDHEKKGWIANLSLERI
jgi:tetratricopeptide (TPR) repeat protein